MFMVNLIEMNGRLNRDLMLENAQLWAFFAKLSSSIKSINHKFFASNKFFIFIFNPISLE
jgi:hypothetical protein